LQGLKKQPARIPAQQRQVGLLEHAITQRDWPSVEAALLAYVAYASMNAVPAPTPVGVMPDITPAFLEQVARVIEFVEPLLGSQSERFQEQMRDTLRTLRADVVDAGNAPQIRNQLADFNLRLSLIVKEQMELQQALLALVQFTFKNIGEFSPDDAWLQGQIKALEEAAQPPLNLHRLREVEHLVKDVLFKQTEVKGRALEAQEALRAMLATFITRLAQMNTASSEYQEELQESLQALEQAKVLEDIAPVLRNVIRATRDMGAEVASLQAELQALREQAQAKESAEKAVPVVDARIEPQFEDVIDLGPDKEKAK
jgi:diguanylate cyclase